MNEFNTPEELPLSKITFKSIVTAVLMVFVLSTFLGFSLYVSLKPIPAQAFPVVVVGNVVEIIKLVMKSVALMMAVKFSMDLMAKLEQNHVIRNVLYYSDALQFDQYLGDYLSKLTKERTLESDQVIIGPDGEPTTQTFQVSGPSSKSLAQLKEDINKYAPGFESLNEVDAQKLGFLDKPFDPVVEASLTRVGIALLTSEAQCGGSNQKLVRNIAIYNAARVLGFNPREISPRDGIGFYLQLGAYGNPFANKDFQELNLRDVASGAEAEAKRAAQLELLSSGTKSLRDRNFAITRTSGTIVGLIQDQADKAFQAAIEGGDTAFVQSIIRTVLNIAQGVIFSPGGVTLNERSACDIDEVGTARYGDLIDFPDLPKAFITANGKTTEEIKSGDSVDLNWFTGGGRVEGTPGGEASVPGILVNGLPAESYPSIASTCKNIPHSGSCSVSPTQDTVYELYVDIDVDQLVEVGGGDDPDSNGLPDGIIQGAFTDRESEEKGEVLGETTRDPNPALITSIDSTVTELDSFSGVLQFLNKTRLSRTKRQTELIAGADSTIQLLEDFRSDLESDSEDQSDLLKRLDFVVSKTIDLRDDVQGGLSDEAAVTRALDKVDKLDSRIKAFIKKLLELKQRIESGIPEDFNQQGIKRLIIANTSVTISPEVDDGDPGGGGGGGGSTDFIGDDPSPAPPNNNLKGVKWLHDDVSGWSVTSNLGQPNISTNQICLDHTKRGQWPVNDNGTPKTDDDLDGNPWIFASIEGTWYAGTYEWLRPGQECKALEVPSEYSNTKEALGPHIKKSPMDGWKPRKGELVGFMVSTLARNGVRSEVNERTNVVWLTWPY